LRIILNNSLIEKFIALNIPFERDDKDIIILAYS